MTQPDDTAAGSSGGYGRSIPERLENRVEMVVPGRHNERLRNLIERVNEDDDLYALWIAANVTAIERLGMSDHGPVHVKIVMNIAVRMLRLLIDGGIEPSVVRNYGLAKEDAEIVVALAALFHDVGMSIHRDEHEHYSLFVAQPKLVEILGEMYEPSTAAIVRSEVLHAIISHRAGARPLTLEAGILRIADALDMAKGRSRIPFQTGSVGIHSLSAAAIEAVRVEPGDSRPIRLTIEMSNSAGIFQVDELLRRKLDGSGLESYVEIEATVQGETEKRLLDRFIL